MATMVKISVEELEQKITDTFRELKSAREERIREKLTDEELAFIEGELNELLEQRLISV